MNRHPGTIVVGVDDSASCQQALDWAIALASAENRAITLVHASGPVLPAWTDLAVSDPVAAQSALQAAGELVLSKARERVHLTAPDVVVHEEFQLRDPRQVLVEASADAELVVVGSRGRGPVLSLLLGSVGVGLVRHAQGPVVVHRPTHPGEVRNGVLVAADATPESPEVLEFAYRQAALRGLPLTVLHSFFDVAAATTRAHLVGSTGEDTEVARLELAESMAGLAAKYPDVSVRIEIARGVPTDLIVDLSKRVNLVVLGSHDATRSQRFVFGSIAAAVVENAHAPVAVVPVGPHQH